MSLNTSGFLRLNDENDIRTIADRSHQEPVVIFKHSATCPVSAWARDQMSAFARETGRTVYEVVVQYARPVSNTIAERYGIRHESPQVIVLFQDRPQFHVSHRGITTGAVRDALRSSLTQESAPFPASA